MRRQLSSFLASSLPGAQRLWHWGVAVLLALLFANTLFLLARRYGFGCSLDAYEACRVSLFYQASVLIHSLLGVLLVGGAIGFLLIHIPKNLKLAQRRIPLPLTGLSVIVALVLLLWSGLYFLLNAKSEAMRWLYDTHMVVAALLVVIYFGHRFLAKPKQGRLVLAGGVIASFGVAAALVMIEIGVTSEDGGAMRSANASVAAVEGEGYLPPSGVSPLRPHFPSPVALASGAAVTSSERLLGVVPEEVDLIRSEVAQQGFASSVLIGAEKCERCHADTVAQWAASAHRFSSFNNPFYVATLEYLRDTPTEPNEFVDTHLAAFGLPQEASGRVKSRWCASCHDPLLQLTGRMLEDIDKGSVEAQAGLTCLSCHAIADIPDHTGNGNYIWNDQFEDSYLFSDARDGLPALLHDTYLKANPERHVADMMKPLYRTPEFCATCHKVSLDRPVNDYRWLRGQDEYDNWHNSGVAHNAARTFYLPPLVRQCNDCHMPLVEAELGDVAADDNGMVRSHRFAAANTALPALRGDQEQIDAIEQRLRANALRLFIGGVSVREGEVVPLTDGERREIELSDDGHGMAELHVIVRNLNVGHTFPGGTNDSNQAWIEVTATGSSQPLKAGQVKPDGHVAENTRIYSVLAVDRHGRRIDKRNAHEMVAPIFVAVIPPGTADLSRYAIPLDALNSAEDGQEMTLQVRLLWRKFNRPYSEFAFHANRPGFAAFDEVPELPISEIARVSLTLRRDGDRLVATAPPPKGVDSPALLLDYAIGFLRQRDLRLAKQVSSELLAQRPDCVNCLRTHARIELAEGQFAEARQTLTRAEAIAPADPQNAWLWAQLLTQEGRYSAASAALDRALEAFPGDRVAHKLQARIAYLDGRYEASLRSVAAALKIDPEDATAHYYAMRAYRALGDEAAAARAESAYRYHKRDESAQQATLAFRRNEGEANFASQRIKVFPLK